MARSESGFFLANSPSSIEKAFLKQPKVFLSSKKSGKRKRPGKGGNRFWKNIGLGFKTPREAIEANLCFRIFLIMLSIMFLYFHFPKSGCGVNPGVETPKNPKPEQSHDKGTKASGVLITTTLHNL